MVQGNKAGGCLPASEVGAVWRSGRFSLLQGMHHACWEENTMEMWRHAGLLYEAMV